MTRYADFDAIRVGDRQQIVKVITETDVRNFVQMTGDDNPLHVDRAYAQTTSFKGIVVHGMLGASFISTVIGTRLPGPGALWVTQNFEFLLPVRIGDELTISCTVTKKHDRERLLDLDTVIANQNQQTVLTGTGKVKVLTVKEAAPLDEQAEEQVAIVTGGAGGIGRAICLRLARDGLAVVVNFLGSRESALSVVAEVTASGGRAVAVQADVSTPEGAQKLYDEAGHAFGEVTVLVNNASPRINPKPFAVTEWADVQRHLDVQLKGAFLMTKACLPAMVARHSGRIVNITSQAADGAPSITWTGYAVAKSAVAALSRYLAAEFGPSGITVNCVSPGMTETSLIGDVPEKVQMMIARQTPLRRLATPDDVAAAVAYLVSKDSGFVTGLTLRVNGGSAMS